jgi:cation:H+ antiporter
VALALSSSCKTSLERVTGPAYLARSRGILARVPQLEAKLSRKKLLLSISGLKGLPGAMSALWTFPAILGSAFLVAWAAEAAQFLIAQGLALAILAWLQTLPEFAVEAVIAWQAGKDFSKAHLAIANFTGAIRLLIGLGWPMIYFVSAWSAARNGRRRTWADVRLDDEHSIEVMGLILPVLYFFVIWYKSSISLIDSAVLIILYIGYLVILWRMPPRDLEDMVDVGRVPRAVLRLGSRARWSAIVTLFVSGGALLYFTAAPFLKSMLALAAALGFSDFVFVQWVAPFLSEFPEKVSAFYWARKVSTAPTALMNMVSSNINQWTVLAAMIPIVYSLSVGHPAALPFDGEQRLEILITILQSVLAFLILNNMRFAFWEAGLLLVLWVAQFLRPSLRDEICWIYGTWAFFILVTGVADRSGFRAPRLFLELFRVHFRSPKTPA